MYSSLLVIHSLLRWLVLISLIFSIRRAYKGYISNSIFTRSDNKIRHWTATIAHIQLIVGFSLYLKSPVVKYFFSHFKAAIQQIDTVFFGAIHFLLMLTAIVIITVGSALAKRKDTDRKKYETMLLWFSIALIIIFIAIPWPFSPLAGRPYIRTF